MDQRGTTDLAQLFHQILTPIKFWAIENGENSSKCKADLEYSLRKIYHKLIFKFRMTVGLVEVSNGCQGRNLGFIYSS